MKKIVTALLIGTIMTTVPVQADEYMTSVATVKYTTDITKANGSTVIYTVPSGSTETKTRNSATSSSTIDLVDNSTSVPPYANYLVYNKNAWNGYTSIQKKFVKRVINAIKHSGNKESVNLGCWKMSQEEIWKMENRISNMYFPFEGQLQIKTTRENGKTRVILWAKETRKYVKANNIIIQRCKKVVSGYVPTNGTTKEKVFGIEKAICRHMTFAERHNLDYALRTGRGACDMYSDIFLGACFAYHIPCKWVGGEAYSDGSWDGHAWNKVLIGKKWYYADVTWLDTAREKKYKLSKKLWKSHVED